MNRQFFMGGFYTLLLFLGGMGVDARLHAGECFALDDTPVLAPVAPPSIKYSK